MATASIQTQVQEQVREIVSLLMKRPITEAIAMRVETIPGFEHLEVVDGDWVGFDEDEIMAGEQHGRLEYKILLRLGNFVEQHDLGMLYTGDTDFVLDGEPDNIRLKRRLDIGFVTKVRYKPTEKYYYGAPDLAVEIISPTERPGQIRRKLNDYLEHAVKEVWQVYPDSKQIVVNYPDRTSKTYDEGDTLVGGDLLPGFMLDVGKVFAVK